MERHLDIELVDWKSDDCNFDRFPDELYASIHRLVSRMPNDECAITVMKDTVILRINGHHVTMFYNYDFMLYIICGRFYDGADGVLTRKYMIDIGFGLDSLVEFINYLNNI